MSISVNRGNEMDSLIAELANDHGLARQAARESFVRIRKPAVAPLMKALQHPNWRIRWGAAQALGRIADPAAADAPVKTLEDERSGVRWLAAEGLIALRHDGLTALPEALTHHSDSVWLREGAHHLIHSLTEVDVVTVQAGTYVSITPRRAVKDGDVT
jgi:HEAT repeat protein